MNSVDILGIGVILFFAILQTIRGRNGMGKPLFEMIGVIIAAFASVSWYEGLAKISGISPALAIAILFILLGFLSIFFANLLFSITDWSFESLDMFFSFFFGIALGWAVSHILFNLLILSYGKASPFAYAVEESRVAKEILEFKTFKAIIALLYRAKLGPEITP